MEFAARLREIRRGRRLTQVEASEIAGIAYGTWEAVESRRRFPSLRTTIAMARALNVTPSFLLRGVK